MATASSGSSFLLSKFTIPGFFTRYTGPSKLRLILMGQSAFAEKCLEAILGKESVEVIAVYTNPDTPQRPEPVRVLAESKGVKVFQHQSLKKTDEAFKEWQSMAPDLVILAYVTQYVPDSMITIPK